MIGEGIKRVKVSVELLDELKDKWSKPVQVSITGTDEDGDLKMIFRMVPTPEKQD